MTDTHKHTGKDWSTLLQQAGLDWATPKDTPPETTPVSDADVQMDVQDDGTVTMDASERGRPGTPVEVGRIVPSNHEYAPAHVRGSRGSWGTYEKVRDESEVVAGELRSIKTTLMIGSHTISMPEGHEGDSQLKAATEWTREWWQRLNPDEWVPDAVDTAIQYGFSPRELTWGETDGKPHPSGVYYREPSTVYRWLLDKHRRHIVGCRFRPWRQDGYVLWRWATDRHFAKGRTLIVPRIGDKGLNIEGRSALRPLVDWVKLRQLLMRIEGVGSEKYSIPIVAATEEPMSAEDEAVNRATGDARHSLANIVDILKATDAPVIELSPGQKIEFYGPQGKMPDNGSKIEQIQHIISKGITQQSSVLARQATGSFALAKVEDDQATDAAAGYWYSATRPIQRLIDDVARYAFPGLDATPQLTLQIGSKSDNQEKLSALSEAMGGQPMTRWPKPLVKVGLKLLDEDPSMADDIKPDSKQEKTSGGNR